MQYINVSDENKQAELNNQRLKEDSKKRTNISESETDTYRVERLQPVDAQADHFLKLADQMTSQMSSTSQFEKTPSELTPDYTHGATPTLGQESQRVDMNDG